jgi:hypothetical protein
MMRLMAVLLFFGGCHETEWQPVKVDRVTLEEIPDQPNVTILAPKELILATVLIDGKERRALWPDALIDHPRWWAVRSLLGNGPAANARLQLARGNHVLSIESDGYAPIGRNIVVGSGIVEIRVVSSELVKNDRPSVTGRPAAADTQLGAKR